jgi:alkylation response protein AidB-like acyl-CoA dehydrogenase
MTGETVLQSVREISESFAQDRGERQLRRSLDPADFEQLKQAGFLLTGVTAEEGGLWESVRHSTRTVCELLRTLAHGDSSVALGGYLLTGQKHFGSGSGVTSFMITSALAEGEQQPDWFFLDMRGVPWDGSAGVTLLAEWDGHGMTATQSHAMSFTDFPATRFAWPGNLLRTAAAAGPFVGCAFAAVIVGIAETALTTARAQLGPKHESLRPYEQVEWSRAEVEGWLIQQAYEGMLRAVEADENAYRSVLRGKTAIAELAESLTGRICKVVGGGTFARRGPFGFWYEDVRALGFLRPPWGLAYDGLFATSWSEAGAVFGSAPPR